MALKNGIRSLLLAQPSITSLCGSQSVDNVSVPAIFVETTRQGVKPAYIVISLQGHDPMKTLTTTTGMAKTRVDIECYAYTDTKAGALGKAVSDFLKDYSGPAGISDIIDAVLWEDTTEIPIPENSGGDHWRYGVIQQFTVFHS